MTAAPCINKEIENLRKENQDLKNFLFKFDISYPIFNTKILGGTTCDKIFSIPKELYDNWKLFKINIYHDHFYTTGIEMFYINSQKEVKSFKFGEGQGIKKSLEFKNNEIIENLIINAGSLIDGITIDTNKGSIFGRIEKVGGTGYFFDIKKISEIFKKKIELIGFEGNYTKYINQIKAIFKFI